MSGTLFICDRFPPLARDPASQQRTGSRTSTGYFLVELKYCPWTKPPVSPNQNWSCSSLHCSTWLLWFVIQTLYCSACYILHCTLLLHWSGVCRWRENLLHDPPVEENILWRLELQRPGAVGSRLLWRVQRQEVPHTARPQRHHWKRGEECVGSHLSFHWGRWCHSW